jgi:hypothetical protein
VKGCEKRAEKGKNELVTARDGIKPDTVKHSNT